MLAVFSPKTASKLAQLRGDAHARSIIILLLVLHSQIVVNADTIYQGSLPTTGAKIVQVSGDQLIYEINGVQRGKELAKVTRIDVPGEATLNSAEEAFSTEKWDDAVDAYQKSIASASRPWIKDWAARRLLDAAQKSGRFDAAVSAYIVTLLKDPAAAAQHKPMLPDSQSTYLNTALEDVRNTLSDTTLSPAQRTALLSFAVELNHAKGDKAAEDAAYQLLAKQPGAADADPNIRKIAAQRNLDAAAEALRSGDTAKVNSTLTADASTYSEPSQQADALFLLAQAADKSAGSDKAKLQDAALAYMRVVAVAKVLPQQPHVVASLLRTAELLKQIGDGESARRLYSQIAAQYPDDPAATVARQQSPKPSDSSNP